MGLLADRLDTMRIHAEVANGSVVGELSQRTRVRVAFQPGVYEMADPTELERQLENLARRLWTGRMREYYAARSEAFEEPISREALPVSQRDVDFYRSRDEMVFEGRSAEGHVTVTLTHMRDFRVRIAPGTQRTLTENEFADAVEQAAGDLLGNQRKRIRELKLTVYGDDR